MPTLLRRYLLKTIFLIAITELVSITDVRAQIGTPFFQVIHLPRKAGYSKEKLNGELTALKDKEAVKKLLRSKNFPSETSIVLQVNRPGNSSTYWTINTSAPSDKEDSRIILQSRDNTGTRFYKLSEFKNYFKDTVAVIDTLAIELLIREEDYPDDQYILAAVCGKNTIKKMIPLLNGKLIFSKALTDSCTTQPVVVTIYNNKNVARQLASCKLYFLTGDDKERLLALASFERAKEPGKSIKDIALMLHGYALNQFGSLSFPQLLNWLQKNTSAPDDGRN